MRPCGRELLGLEQYYPADRRRPSARMAARWESALHSMCPHGLLGPSGDSVEWLAMCTWCRATPRQLRGSPTHTNGLHGCACEDTVSCKMSDVSVPRCGAVGATRLGRIPGQHCGRTSKFERRELSVVVFRRVLIYKTAGYGGAVRWCRERESWRVLALSIPLRRTLRLGEVKSRVLSGRGPHALTAARRASPSAPQ